MKDNNSASGDKNKTFNVGNIIITLIIILQLINLIYSFAVLKKGIHSDECFSYGLANAYYQPFLNTLSHNDAVNVLNYNEWVSGDVIDNYFTVRADQRFAYGSVIYNNSKDVHPPFYYMVLHTICSFFPGQFSWWYGFALNIVLFVLTQVFLYKLVKKITKDNTFLALLVCGLYGFTQGAIDTFIYIRMYAMITFFGVLSVYLHTLLLEKFDKKRLFAIGFLTFLGGYTNYYYLIFECALTACICFYMLFKKRYKQMFMYALIQLVGAVMVIVAFPAIFDQFGFFDKSFVSSAEYQGFTYEMIFYKVYMVRELFGVIINAAPSYLLIYLAEAILWISIIGGPLYFLFRKETWFIKGRDVVIVKTKDFFKFMYNNTSIFVVLSSIACIAVYILIGMTATILDFGVTTVRYMFISFPYIYMVLVIVIYNLLLAFANLFKYEDFKKKNITENCIKTVMLIAAICLCFNIYKYSAKAFYYNYGEEKSASISKLDRSAQFIIANRSNWFINVLGTELVGIDSFFHVSPESFFDNKTMLDGIDKEKKLYLILSRSNLQDALLDERGELNSSDTREKTYSIEELVEMENENANADSDVNAKYIEKYRNYLVENGVATDIKYIGQDAIYGRYFYLFEIIKQNVE